MTTDVASVAPGRTVTPIGGRVLAKTPSLFKTAVQLPEVRWAAVALALFAAGWACQLVGTPATIWWALYLLCYISGGWESALSGLRALQQKTLDVDLLMIVAAMAAASIGQVFDGALLIVIFATSGALETLVTRRTAETVSALLNLAPEKATLIRHDGNMEEIETGKLQAGDIILIRPGERIGADGKVVSGESEVDQQAITGESVPVSRRGGDDVLSGTVNGTGMLRVRVSSPASQTVIARIVAMVEQASATKAKRQLFIEDVEQRYSMGVVIATLLVFAVPYLVLNHSLEDSLLRAITLMIVASPCAVVLSTMPPLLAAIANAGRHGVLVKSATAMEVLGRTSLVAFDKTGTLTEGKPKVIRVTPMAGGLSSNEVLAIAASVEQYSEHPLGQAIVSEAKASNVVIRDATNFLALPGRGVRGIVGPWTIEVERAQPDSRAVGTVVSVRNHQNLLGSITLIDGVRWDAASAVQAVAAMTSAPTHLLTGDNELVARHVASVTGVEIVHAGLLPEDKTRIVAELEAKGARVLLVGDGVNDAPALAEASVGVAMGRYGSDLALETADAIVVRDELMTIPSLIGISRRARRFVIANLAIAATFIVVLVTWDLVSFLPLPLAVAGHEGSTVIVALNGLRLLKDSAWKEDWGDTPTV